MRELWEVRRHTRGVVLVAVLAALYAAVQIPFKALPIIPGSTDLRPAAALPVVFSFLFGPCAAWGSALGNLIADLFGTFGPGTLFGLAGNLLYGLIPWRLCRAWSTAGPSWRVVVPKPGFVLAVLPACAACAVVIGWGLHLLRFVPFPFFTNVVLINNVLFALTLAPALLSALAPRLAGCGIGGTAAWMSAARPPRWRAWVGTLLIVVGSVGGWGLGNALALGVERQPMLAMAPVAEGSGIPSALAPLILCVIAGALIL
jgi:energy-coupling factor transport system substrate-specific component